jgi:cobalt/nickel transport protein
MALALTAFSAPSLAHFQLLYSAQTNVTGAQELPLKLVFWHPYSNGPVMDMGAPEALYAINRGQKIDLMDSLQAVRFQGAANSATAFEAMVPIRRAGDYVLVLKPAPFYEASEDIFIQQITKSYINQGQLPSDWDQPQDLETEILPLVKPTNVLAGSTFRGRVMSAGQPVAGATIEVELIAALPNMQTNAAGPAFRREPPGGAIVVLSDDHGYFSFGIPHAGTWGFAALGVGPQQSHEGKPLSQDAVIWVTAYDANY